MDEKIVLLLQQRDQRSIELIAEHYEKLIRYIAVTILRERETSVEECINDVYLKLWTHGAEYDYQKASFKTYLKVITRNTALNYLRKMKRLEELEGSAELDALQSEYIDYRQNLEQQVIFQEEVQTLNRILASLKKKDRELVMRRFYYLQSTKQIAVMMGISEAAVDTRLSRLRKKIKKKFDKEVTK